MFTHQDVESASIEVEIGEDREKVLVVRTSLSLWPRQPGIRRRPRGGARGGGTELYAGERGLDRIRMISTKRFEQRRI